MNYDPSTRLIDRKELSSRLGISRRQSYRIKGLPQPISLHNSANSKRLWTEAQISEWIEELRRNGGNN
jgi:predicted DNA-binding transcriptional regulator AlpA